jgi:hypothetical protein
MSRVVSGPAGTHEASQAMGRGESYTLSSQAVGTHEVHAGNGLPVHAQEELANREQENAGLQPVDGKMMYEYISRQQIAREAASPTGAESSVSPRSYLNQEVGALNVNSSRGQLENHDNRRGLGASNPSSSGARAGSVKAGHGQ